MERGVELIVVNADIDVQKSNVGGGSVLGQMDGIVNVEPFKKNSEGVSLMGPK